ncbi:uncharacterized protein LOC105697254 [Orussus abietinus]|uniref:uncharacterized protein LOC105697254 n=1 Tax=Orussus abietinus TaxID=222816 RepID=UPI0006263495|nr:uncharacterized protein LOC105697254 [Orussus abietinus]
MCCLSRTLEARIIGTLGVSSSILMINILVSDFFSRDKDDELLGILQTWAHLGMNWTQMMKNSRLEKKIETILICFLVYATLFLLASSYLILGSVAKKRKYAKPWLFLQAIGIIDQFLAFMAYITRNSPTDDQFALYIPTYIMYMLVSLYFWLAVFEAQKTWSPVPLTIPQHIDNREVTTNSTTDSVVTKTPSFLANNYSFFGPPLSSNPPKHEQV